MHTQPTSKSNHNLAHCGYCRKYQQPTDAMHAYAHNHAWRRSPDGTWYTICHAYTVELLPAGYWSIYSRGPALYTRATSLASAIASCR